MTHAKAALIRALEKERDSLNRVRLFGAYMHPRQKLSNARRNRLAQIEAWLFENPPPKFAYRCKHCFLGTNLSERVCLGCEFA